MSMTVFTRQVTKIGIFDVDFQGLKFPKSAFAVLPNIGDKRYVCYDEHCTAEVMEFDDVWG